MMFIISVGIHMVHWSILKIYRNLRSLTIGKFVLLKPFMH